MWEGFARLVDFIDQQGVRPGSGEQVIEVPQAFTDGSQCWWRQDGEIDAEVAQQLMIKGVPTCIAIEGDWPPVFIPSRYTDHFFHLLRQAWASHATSWEDSEVVFQLCKRVGKNKNGPGPKRAVLIRS